MSEMPAVCDLLFIASLLQEDAYIVHIPALATPTCHHLAGQIHHAAFSRHRACTLHQMCSGEATSQCAGTTSAP